MIREEKINKRLEDEAVDYIESFFTTGVEFDTSVFEQSRIKSVAKSENNKTKFIFFPTYTVTSFAFNQII